MAEPCLWASLYLLTLTLPSHFLGTRPGFHLGILNTAEAWVAQDLNLDISSQGAIITSAVIVGAVVGSLFAGQSADALGPKKALLLNNAWLLIGCVLCSGTPFGYWGLLAGLILIYLANAPQYSILHLCQQLSEAQRLARQASHHEHRWLNGEQALGQVRWPGLTCQIICAWCR